MQVKKFEAETMQDALNLVKQELGPDAIILNAKDNKKNYGIAGKKSIEVTAAISGKAMAKRQFTEERLGSDARERFRTGTAKNQKAFIEKTINKYSGKPGGMIGGASSMRYIDIQDDGPKPEVENKRVEQVIDKITKQSEVANMAPVEKTLESVPPMPVSTNSSDVISLKKEVETLRGLLSDLQEKNTRQPVTQHPGAEFGLPFELSHSFERLMDAGIDNRFIVEILCKADSELTGLEKKKRSLVDGWVARYIMSQTSVGSGWGLNEHKIHCFVGPRGHGKTSSLIKMASHLVLNEKKKVAIFTADLYKVGSAEQLKIYSKILNVPFETIKHSVEIAKLAHKYEEYDAILIDFPGFAMKEITEIDQLRSLLPHRDLDAAVHLVISCTSRDTDAYEICHRYQVTHYDDFVITRLDESATHGIIYNVQRKTEKPLYAFGVGSVIPEDIELATRERVLDMIYRLTKNGLKESNNVSNVG